MGYPGLFEWAPCNHQGPECVGMVEGEKGNQREGRVRTGPMLLGFELEEEGQKPRDADGLYKPEKARKQLLPGASRSVR